MPKPLKAAQTKMKAIILCVFASLVVVLAERKSYRGYNVYQVTANSLQQVKTLKAMEEAGHFEIWKLARNATFADIWMGPKEQNQVPQGLRELGMQMRLHPTLRNIPELIESEYKRLDERYAKDKYSFDLNDFNTYDAIIKQISVWEAACPSGLECSTYSIGNSYYGRQQRVINIKKAGSGYTKRAIFLEHTIHSREWLSTTTIQNVIHHIINDYGSDAEVNKLIDNFNLFILPIANPDGYLYTWSGDRMWRKSRRPNAGSVCSGTDINRNFDSHWAKQGASWNTCYDTYNGPSAASEVETQNIQNESQRLKTNGAKLFAWFATHCCADMWMFPYGFTRDYKSWTECMRTVDHNDLQMVANAAVRAIGKGWKAGTVCEIIYPATGDVANFMYDERDVKYTFAIELGGQFISPKSYIQPVYKDFWTGLMASVNKMLSIDP